MKKLYFFSVLLLFVVVIFGQVNAQVAINADGSTPDGSAILDVKSTSLGVLIPRMTASDRTNISTPAEGLLVYQNDGTAGLYYYDGSNWKRVGEGVPDDDWIISGSDMYSGVSGNVGIGTTSPSYPLHVVDDNASTVGYFVSTETSADNHAVEGVCANTDYYGYGGYFVGGWKGVYASVYPSGAHYYYGVEGYVNGGSGNNYALYGSATGSGYNYGLRSYTSGGNYNYGVYASAYNNYSYGAYFSSDFEGVRCDVSSSNNNWLYGFDASVINSKSGGSSRGVYASASGDNATAIYGYAYTATSNWVYGVWSYVDSDSDNGTEIGVAGSVSDNNGYAVYGTNWNSSGTGFMGIGNGLSTFTYATNGGGVGGNGDKIGVYGYSHSSDNNVARAGGYFEDLSSGSYAWVGYHYNSSDYKIIGNGSNSTIIKTAKGDRVALISPEAPEALFQDYGTGQLKNGKAHITLDPTLSNAISVDKKHPLKVFIQLEGDCNGVYVTNKTKNGFDVIELNGGHSNIPFSWFIVANRADEISDKGVHIEYDDLRFPPAPSPMPSKSIKTEKNMQDIQNENLSHEEPVTPADDPKQKTELEKSKNMSKN